MVVDLQPTTQPHFPPCTLPYNTLDTVALKDKSALAQLRVTLVSEQNDI